MSRARGGLGGPTYKAIIAAMSAVFAVVLAAAEIPGYKAERASVLPFVGEHVTITGEVVGETVRVKKIRKSPAPVQH